jgi:hypothetical protein
MHRIPAAPQRLYHVYVIELEQSLCVRRKCLSRNGRPPVYVGQSATAPETRFKQHKSGYKASRVVRDHGVKLVPALSRGFGPFSEREDALDAEARLAERLTKLGYCVFGGH